MVSSLGGGAALGRIAGFGRNCERTVGHVTDTQSGRTRRVRAGGVRLAYRVWGPAEAPPVVLLHALGEASTDWTPVASALAPSWRLYAPDLRGHGASDWPGSYTIEQLTADLAAFLDALDLDYVTLCGHSIGGPSAYLYAARHPERVARLVLEEPAPPWPRTAGPDPSRGCPAVRLGGDNAEQRVRRPTGHLLARFAPARPGPGTPHRGRASQSRRPGPARAHGHADPGL